MILISSKRAPILPIDGFRKKELQQGCDADLLRTAKPGEMGQFELYKTSYQSDGTYANPQWVGRTHRIRRSFREYKAAPFRDSYLVLSGCSSRLLKNHS
jgi:hypothetical protein